MRFKWILFFPALLLLGCNKDSDVKIKADNEVNEFVWRGLNYWYYWQAEVPELDDARKRKENDLTRFLNSYTDPNTLFYDLLHNEDRFSVIVEDYVVLENFLQGITKSFGYEIGLEEYGDSKFLAYVKYVVPGSPADLAGIVRGNLFTLVNGTQLTIENYRSLLFGSESYTIELAEIVDGEISNTGQEITMTAVQITENPVFLSKVLEVEGVKIGYLVYNGFTHTFHHELNLAFLELKNSGIDELVLDLRYNGGGAISTSQHLAAMIYGAATNQTIFAKYRFNEKRSNNNFIIPFQTEVRILDGDFNTVATENMNRLDLSRLYVLVSGSTASASEMLINGLDPYMEVIRIGTTTVGKNEGSITLYDSPGSSYIGRDNADPDHTWAMQPIVLKVANAEDFSGYSSGLLPDIEIDETDYLADLKPLGDPEEVLLQVAIADITGVIARLEPGKSPKTKSFPFVKHPLSQEMYLDGSDLYR